MKSGPIRAVIASCLLALALPSLGYAQAAGEAVTPVAPAPAQPPVQPSAPVQPAGGEAAAQPPAIGASSAQITYQPAQLDQLLAPIALYPDSLLTQILMASTYPLELVEAARWLEDANNAALKGDALTAALGQQNWDPSVKSLVPFPAIVKLMSDKLDWTQQLGDAFLAQQADVMASVQRLRHEAQAAGKLVSTPQEAVTTEGSDIIVTPADGDVYVPYYDPNQVYGDWPYPDYPPYFWPPWPGFIFAPGFAIGFGFGIGLDGIGPYWGWSRFDWGGRGIYVDPARYGRINGGRAPAFAGDHWQHDPTHRRGVPYRDTATAAHFGRAATGTSASSRAVRGYSTPAAGGLNFARPTATVRGTTTRGAASFARPSNLSPSISRGSTGRASTSAFEGYGRGAEIRSEATRGAASRQSFTASHAAPHFSVPSRGASISRGAVSRGGGTPSGGGAKRR